MNTIEDLAAKLRAFWLRDIGAISTAAVPAGVDGSYAINRTVFISSTGGTVGINTPPQAPYALDLNGHERIAGNLIPRAGNAWNIGAAGAPFQSLYVADLHVGTLVAQNEVATIGGRLIVAPTTKLIAAMDTSATTLDVSAASLTSGDRIYLEASGKLEWLAVTSGATAITGGYRYTVTRNLNAAGAQPWSAGDAVINTGTTGQGFIDLYSRYGIPASGQSATARQGPTIAGNVRTGTAWDAMRERWAIGNLIGLYGYSVARYGFAAGDPTASWVAADDTDGVRIMRGSVARVQLSTAGTLTINDSTGAPVFTFDASAGAAFTLPLTISTNGGIYQGTGTFASPDTGLKIWNASGVGRIGGYNAGVVQWYADTDGRLYAGAGAVALSASGIRIECGPSQFGTSAVMWSKSGLRKLSIGTISDGGGTVTDGYLSSDVGLIIQAAGNLAMSSQSGIASIAANLTCANLQCNTLTLVGNVLAANDATYDIGAAGVTRFRDLYLSRSAYASSVKLLGATSGVAIIQPSAVAGTPTLTLPTSTGTFALTSDLTASSLSGAYNLSGTTNQITVTGTPAVLLNNAITLSLPQNIHTAATPQFAGVKTGYVYPASDGTTAFQIRKADGITNIVNVNSTNSRVGILTAAPSSTVDVVGDFRLVDVAGATLAGAAQTNRFLSIDNTNADYINLAHYSVNRTRSRGTITVSNSAAAWQNNFVQLMVHGSAHPVNNYCTGTGFATDAGSAIILAQGSEIQALQIGVYDSKPVHLFTANTLRMSIHQSGAISGMMDTMAYAATISLDVTKPNLHKTTTVNATGNATINASAVGTAGQHMWILIVNDATSGKVITFGTNFRSSGTLTGTASRQATIHFISDGVSWSEVARTLNL